LGSLFAVVGTFILAAGSSRFVRIFVGTTLGRRDDVPGLRCRLRSGGAGPKHNEREEER
jgi:hypothetical protein